MVEELEGKLVPIDWYVPDDIVSRYANNLVVQFTGHEFVISFFETIPPAIVGPPQEQKTQMERLQSVQAKCVARIIVAPKRMGAFVKVLQDNLGRYLSQSDELE